MIYYSITFIVASCIYLILKIIKKCYWKSLSHAVVCALTLMPLLVNAVIRYGVGFDYFNYLEIEKYSDFAYEPGFAFLNNIILYFNLSPLFIHVFFAIIFFSFILQVTKDSSSPLLSVFLLIASTNYFLFLNISRQMCACAITLYSIRYIEKNELIKFIFCIK